ncbi:(4Fe-4S)-binding protein [Streptomyces sp. NPDC058067]|uniref:(4Fe-4S)-binding protein n=1 Tax=Streptomyces sp. NPDC058067 TaxID=3346324 RepID=UPI0036E2CB05
MTAKPYEGKDVTVTFDGERCLHSAECVRGLPRVFDTARRPWIDPDGAPAAEVAEVIRRCPSGALQYQLADGPEEKPAEVTTVVRTDDGRLVMRGDLRVGREGAEDVRETRVTLCGCGASGHQPYCDHSGRCGAGS